MFSKPKTVHTKHAPKIDNTIPMWYKDAKGVMRHFNKAYYETFLKPRGIEIGQYIEATDFDVWPKHIASTFQHNDRETAITGVPFRGKERVVYEGKEVNMCIIKIPHGAGVFGAAIPENKANTPFAKKLMAVAELRRNARIISEKNTLIKQSQSKHN